jgi:hypothetical protein
MATAVFLAKLIGPVMLVAAVSFLIHTKAYRAIAQEFMRSAALIYLSGILAMVAGLAIVLAHNVWILDWRVLITIFGWLALVGGAVRIALPDQTRAFGERMLRNDMTLRIGGASWAAVGATFCFYGYVR